MGDDKPFESAASELVPESEHPLDQLRLLDAKAEELGRAGDVDAVVECRIKQVALQKVLVHLHDAPVRDLVAAQIVLAEAYAEGDYRQQAQDHLAQAKETFVGGVHDDGQAQRLQVDLQMAEGTVHLALGDLDAAQRLLQEAMDRGNQVFGEYTTRGTRGRVLLGHLAQRQGRIQDAAEEFLAACRIHESLYGADHEDTLRWRLKSAEALYAAGRREEAMQEQMRARDELTERRQQLPDLLVATLAQLARWLEAQGRDHDGEALEALLHAEQVCEDQGPELEDPKVVDIKRDIALLQLKMGRTDTALEYLQHVEYLERRLHGSQSTNVARTLKALGTVHMVRRNMEDADRCFQQALRIFEVDYPPNKEIMRDIKSKLQSIAAAARARG